jgi:hypothetical protein
MPHERTAIIFPKDNISAGWPMLANARQKHILGKPGSLESI